MNCRFDWYCVLKLEWTNSCGRYMEVRVCMQIGKDNEEQLLIIDGVIVVELVKKLISFAWSRRYST